MPRDDLILFLDLETTGVDEKFDEIIEIGAVMLDAKTLNEEDSANFLIVPSPAAYDRWMAKDVVRDMHRKNGLQEAIDHLRKMPLRANAEHADDLIMEWLKSRVGNDTTQIPYGGSGVAHFDRRFIQKYLPRFNKMITHWAYDVGTIRRSFVRLGLQTADNLLSKRSQEKDHRALQDAKVHADEFRYYSHYFKTGEFPDGS